MQTNYIAMALLLAILSPMVLSNLAFAQTYGSTPQTSSTLEENLKLAREKIKTVQANPHTGSGTPVLDAGGVAGASIVVGGMFTTIFIICVVYAKHIEKQRKSVAR